MNTREAIRAGVIGHPIAHSKSPLIHNHWIKRYGLSGSYEAIDIAPDDLSKKLPQLFDEGYAGFNVTIPHKEAVMDLCDDVTDVAARIGAVNTLYKDEGRIIGTNTDAFGFMENLNVAIRHFGFSYTLQNGPAVVLGAGGAAKAVVYGLLEEGVPEIILVNRSKEKAEALAKNHPAAIRVAEWDQRSAVLEGANFLVNTTSLGMDGKDALEIDLRAAPENMLVADIVYTPLLTDLLKQARDYDLRIVTGIGMLLHQARPAFEKWFNILPDVDDRLEELVLWGEEGAGLSFYDESGTV
ncbi:MAG: shikimate dehydrogenase [Alphaproteobacteria bacterium]|nr:shikimate dehydrogenase [Alphaproteobacteria bacterium]MCD8569954.1 shikimate dehydrogenase [Alphaproteobacteria bacterium]